MTEAMKPCACGCDDVGVECEHLIGEALWRAICPECGENVPYCSGSLSAAIEEWNKHINAKT